MEVLVALTVSTDRQVSKAIQDFGSTLISAEKQEHFRHSAEVE